MESLEIRNQKIINAVIKREQAVCPGAVALIGVYGSCQTGDTHMLSDLDLLILINDDRGRELCMTFLQEDLGIGHDLYCTSWDTLRRDARYEHPHISKLMDSRIVYCADEKYRVELEALRAQVRRRLAEPFGEADLRNAERLLKEAEHCYTAAMTAESLNDVRVQAGGVLYFAEDAVALLNKTYFRYGVRRCYEELNAMKRRPEKLCERIEGIVNADSVASVQQQLTLLMRELTGCFHNVRQTLLPEKRPADAGVLRGTYEEMVSNWRGKLRLAADTGDRHLAFESLVSLHEMAADIGKEAAIGRYEFFAAYDPADLRNTAEQADAVLQEYLQEYRKAGLKVERFRDIDAFVDAYLSAAQDQG